MKRRNDDAVAEGRGLEREGPGGSTSKGGARKSLADAMPFFESNYLHFEDDSEEFIP